MRPEVSRSRYAVTVSAALCIKLNMVSDSLKEKNWADRDEF